MNANVDTDSLREQAYALGISDVGVCAAREYDQAEQAISDRRGRGKFADLQFTMTRTPVSCHPESQLDGRAVSVVSAALCYWAPEADEHADDDDDDTQPRGRIARYTRGDAYAALTERLASLAQWLRDEGHDARVLVDSNEHVDREAARRSGVGFSGKHTNIITRRFGSWVVLGTLVTSAPLVPTEPMRPGCGTCTACIDACPTDALIDIAGGELDASRCITYWSQSRHAVPDDIRERSGDLLYGCDICQDACPWNRGVERRLANTQPVTATLPIVEWLTASNDELDKAWQRLYVPRRNMDFLRRNALIALAHAGTQRDAALAAPYLDDASPLLREQAAWTLRMLGGPIAAAALRRVRR